MQLDVNFLWKGVNLSLPFENFLFQSFVAYSTRKLHVSELFSLIALGVLADVKGSEEILLPWLVQSNILILNWVSFGWPYRLVLSLIA